MMKQNAKLITGLLFISDIVISVISFVFAYWIRSNYHVYFDLPDLYPLSVYMPLLFIIIPLWSVLLLQFRAYRSYRTTSFFNEFTVLVKVVAVGGLLLGAISFASKSTYISRTFILVFIVTSICLLTLERLILRMTSHVVRQRGFNYRNILIVGTNTAAVDIIARIEQYKEWGLRLVGVVQMNAGGVHPGIGNDRLVGTLDNLEKIIHEHVVDEVIFAISGSMLPEIEDKLLMLEEHGIDVRLTANIFPHIIAKIHIEEFETIPLLTFTTVPTSPIALLSKRVFDVGVSFFALLLLAPLMFLVSLIIKLTSPGPIFFKQKRVGLHGRIFTLYKFRSMYADAEEKRKELESHNEMTGPAFKMANDPRITPIGRFIRKASIDELPQLWNVLVGDMSIVGPRPPIPEEVSRYERWQRRRLSMRPGLTCLWQISGRNKITDFREWVKLDLQYIDTWSLGLDFKIFLKTIPVVLMRKGAE